MSYIREETDSDVTMWAMMCHLSTFAGMAFPLGNIIAPVVIWAIKGKEHPFIDEQGREAVNFQINITIYMFIAFILLFVGIGFILFPILTIVDLILTIIAAIKTKDGYHYKYPCIIRLL